MPKNDNSENKQQVENLTKALAVYATKQELVVGQKKANDDAAETHDIVVDNQKKAKKLDPTLKKGVSLPVVITSDESKDSVPEADAGSAREADAGSGNEYVDKLGRKADKSAGRVDDAKSAENKLALMEAEDKHNKDWAPALKMKADAEALATDPAGFLKKVLLEKMLIAFSAKARAQAKVDKDDERLATAEADAKRKSEAQALQDIIDGTVGKEKKITEYKKEAAEIDASKDESIGTALSATPDATFDDPLTELNSSGVDQVELLTTQNTLLEKLVSSSRDDSRTSAAEELANEAKDKDGKGKGNDILSVVKDKKDKTSSSLSDMFGKKSSFGKMFGKKGSMGKMFGPKGSMGKMFGKKGSLGKMFGGKLGGLGGKLGGLGGKLGGMGGGMMGKAGGLMSKLPMGGLGGLASGAMSSMGGLASGAMGALGGGGLAAAATAAAPFIAGAAALAAIGGGGYMLYDSLRGSDESKEVFDQAEEDGIVDHSILGDSTILNWEAVKQMKPDALQHLIDYDDWDGPTKGRLEEILVGGKADVAVDKADKKLDEAMEDERKSNFEVMSRDEDGNTFYSSDTAKSTAQLEQEHIDKGRTVVGEEERAAIKAKAELKTQEAHSELKSAELAADNARSGMSAPTEGKSRAGKLGGWLGGTSEEGKDESTFAEKAYDYTPMGMMTNMLGLTTSESDKEKQQKQKPQTTSAIPEATPKTDMNEKIRGQLEEVLSKTEAAAVKAFSPTKRNKLINQTLMLNEAIDDIGPYEDYDLNEVDGQQQFKMMYAEQLGGIDFSPDTAGSDDSSPDLDIKDLIGSDPIKEEEGDSNFVKSAKMAYDRTALGGLTNMFGLTTSEDDKATGKKSDIFNRLSGTTEEGKDESTLAEKAYDYTPMGLMTNMLGWTTSEADKEKQGEMPEAEEMTLGEMPEGEAGSDIPKRFDQKKRTEEWIAAITRSAERQGGPVNAKVIRRRAQGLAKKDKIKFIKEQNLQKSQGLDQMNQTALDNKTAGVAQGTTPAQPTSNITTDNSVVNNNNITEQRSHDYDNTAKWLNRNNPMNDSF